jgi:hypothetical protein
VVNVLLADVAGHGFVVIVGVAVCRLDPVEVARDQGGDHRGDDFGVADLSRGSRRVS